MGVVLAFAVAQAGCETKPYPAEWAAPGSPLTIRTKCDPKTTWGFPRAWVGPVEVRIGGWGGGRLVVHVPPDLPIGSEQPVRIIWGTCDQSGVTVRVGGGTLAVGGQDDLYTVQVSSSGRGAQPLAGCEVMVDGIAVGKTNRGGGMDVRNVGPGPHRVTAKCADHEEATLIGVEGRRVSFGLRRLDGRVETQETRSGLVVSVEGGCPGGEGVVRWVNTDPVEGKTDTREVPFQLKLDRAKGSADGGVSSGREQGEDKGRRAKGDGEREDAADVEIRLDKVLGASGGVVLGLVNCPKAAPRIGVAFRDAPVAEKVVLTLTEARAVRVPIEVNVPEPRDKKSKPIEPDVAVFALGGREEVLVTGGKGKKVTLAVPEIPGVTLYSLTARHQGANGEMLLRLPMATLADLARGIKLEFHEPPKLLQAGLDGEGKAVVVAWEGVIGADLYHLQVGRRQAEQVLPHWDLWVATPGGPKGRIGVGVPLGEAPVSPAEAVVGLTAQSSQGFSPGSFTEGALLRGATLIGRSAPVALEPGTALGPTAEKRGSGTSGIEETLGVSDGPVGVWLASWTEGPPLSKQIPGLLVRGSPGSWEAENLGSHFSSFDVKVEGGEIRWTAERAGPGGRRIAMQIVGGLPEAGKGSAADAMAGRADVEILTAKGEVEKTLQSGVALTRVTRDPSAYRIEKWLLQLDKGRIQLVMRVAAGPEGRFFSGGYEPVTECGGGVCWATLQSWSLPEDGSLQFIAYDEGESCPVTVQFQGRRSGASSDYGGSYSASDCKGKREGDFRAKRL